MKNLAVLLMVCGLMIGLMYADGDVTVPGDPVIGLPNNGSWPGGEAPLYAIDDNITTKYLHFRSNAEEIFGIIVTPAAGSTIVQGITLTTGGDAPGRDPISFELSGSNSSVETGPWTLIASGPVPDFDGDSAWPRQTKTETPMIFSNETAFIYYKLMFPTLRGGTSEIFQISEIELLAKPDNGWAPSVSVTPTTTLLLPPTDTLDIDATVEDVDSTSWTFAWTQVSGPAAVNFNGTENNEDASVTFPAVKGNYVLQIVATDDITANTSEPRQVTVRVWDPAIDEQLVSHWSFDVPDGTTLIHDEAMDNDRGYLGNYNGTHKDPNFVTGWVILPGQTLGNAAEFLDAGYIEVIPDANSVLDPNMLNLDAGVSVASWVKATNWDGNRRVLQYGNPLNNDNDNIFRMLNEGGLKFSSAPGRDLTTTIFPSGEWHHMAGTYDGKTTTIYVDGVLAASETYDTYLPMRAYNGTQVLTIGAKSKLVNFESYPGDYMNGYLDDVRVYSYAIDQDTVRSLVAMGQQSAPGIEAINALQTVVLTGATVDVNIDAVIYDAQGDTLTYAWSQQSPATPAVVFSSTTVEDPTVTFAEAGTYVLRLTVDDGVYGLLGTIYKDVTIAVVDANCAKVKLDGLLYKADLNEDCYVNINDFALMALNWLDCNDPEDAACTNPYLP
jgi:hypothetical protein